MKSTTKTLIEAMRILANEIHSEDGVANAAIFEASERLSEQQKRIKYLEQELQKSTDQNDLILDEFIRVKCLTRNTEIHQLCERAHIRMRQNVPVIERNYRMQKRIAELRKKNAELEKVFANVLPVVAFLAREGVIQTDRGLKVEFDEWLAKRDLEQKAQACYELVSEGGKDKKLNYVYLREINNFGVAYAKQARQLKGGAK